jgi:hypothetical protein
MLSSRVLPTFIIGKSLVASWQEVMPEFVYKYLAVARTTLTEKDEKEIKVLEKRIARRVGEHQISHEDF